MPRRFTNADQYKGGDLIALKRLEQTLHDEHAVRTGRTTWAAIREARRGAKPSREAKPQRTTLDDARKLLAAHINQ